MAMAKCKECGTEISTSAKTCPKCGKPNPIRPKTSCLTGCLALVIIMVVAIAIIPSLGNNSSTPSPPPVGTATQNKAPEKPVQKGVDIVQASIIDEQIKSTKERLLVEKKRLDGLSLFNPNAVAAELLAAAKDIGGKGKNLELKAIRAQMEEILRKNTTSWDNIYSSTLSAALSQKVFKVNDEVVCKIDEEYLRKAFTPVLNYQQNKVADAEAELDAREHSIAEANPPFPYSVKKMQNEQTGKLELSIELQQKGDKKPDESQLRELAKYLFRKYDGNKYYRVFICYLLPGQKDGDNSWATAHFTPDLKVEIAKMGQISPVGASDLASKLPNNNAGSQKQQWFLGGTLHRKTALDWQAASAADKLATCADFVFTMKILGNLKPSLATQIKDVDDIRPYAQELVTFMDTALARLPDDTKNKKTYENMGVSWVAASGMVMMGWTK